MVRNEDEKELARKFGSEHVDTKSATAMFDLLRRKLSHSPAYGHLLSLLQHMLLLPCKSIIYHQQNNRTNGSILCFYLQLRDRIPSIG